MPIGGVSVTAGVAKEFEESFSGREARKKDAGFVSLGGAYADPTDPEVARMSKLIRSTMTRLHAEIMRSISHLSLATAGDLARAALSLRRNFQHALHARILSGEIAGADRVLQSAAQCRGRTGSERGGDREIGQHDGRAGRSRSAGR